MEERPFGLPDAGQALAETPCSHHRWVKPLPASAPQERREASKCAADVWALRWDDEAQTGGVTGAHQLGFRGNVSLCPSAESMEIAAVGSRASPTINVVRKTVLWIPTR